MTCTIKAKHPLDMDDSDLAAAEENISFYLDGIKEQNYTCYDDTTCGFYEEAQKFVPLYNPDYEIADIHLPEFLHLKDKALLALRMAAFELLKDKVALHMRQYYLFEAMVHFGIIYGGFEEISKYY